MSSKTLPDAWVEIQGQEQLAGSPCHPLTGEILQAVPAALPETLVFIPTPYYPIHRINIQSQKWEQMMKKNQFKSFHYTHL